MKAEIVDEGAQEVLTLSQFLRMPEITPSLEFIRGRVEQKVSPNLHHSLLQAFLPATLNQFSKPAGLRVALPELRCSFGGESFVPDIAFFRLDRLPMNERGRYLEKVTLPPDFSIEILPPGQTVKKLSARRERLVRKGVRLGWLIQPRREIVYVFRPAKPVQ